MVCILTLSMTFNHILFSITQFFFAEVYIMQISMDSVYTVKIAELSLHYVEIGVSCYLYLVQRRHIATYIVKCKDNNMFSVYDLLKS